MNETERWGVYFQTIHGDGDYTVLTVPQGTHPFRIPGYARQQIPLLERVTGFFKIKP